MTDVQEEALGSAWAAEGYIVARGLLPADVTAALRDESERILAQWRQRNPETGEPGGGPEATTMRHLNHAGYHEHDPAGRILLLETCADPGILRIAAALLSEDALFRCTSLFFNPLENSRDGNWHRDSQFHHPDEDDEKATILEGGDLGHAIQLQVALVPSDDVEVVPASHLRWDTPEEYAIRRADDGANNRSGDMPGAVRVALEPGDAVAFNPMGLHRGRYHTDKARRTLMLTYTAQSWPRFDYFSDQPWFDEPGYLDGLSPEATRFFGRFVEEYGPQWRAKAADDGSEG